jgi:hypothetical protein
MNWFLAGTDGCLAKKLHEESKNKLEQQYRQAQDELKTEVAKLISHHQGQVTPVKKSFATEQLSPR